MDTQHFTLEQIQQLREDEKFNPLVALFKKFGSVYLDGSIKINLRRPVMPNPSRTKWDKLPFNENDCLIDLVWDLFRLHGASYKTGVEVFDILRNHIPCLVLTNEEKKFIVNVLSCYRSDYEGTSTFADKELDLIASIQAKMGQP